jgi:uncharacterized OsmC-like protein
MLFCGQEHMLHSIGSAAAGFGSHDKVHAENCAECETKQGKIDRIDRKIELAGDLDEAQRARLLEIVNKCPVHRTLHSELWISTLLKT